MRPLVDRAQDLPFFVPGVAHPRSGWQRGLLRSVIRVAGGPVGTALGKVGGLLPDPSLNTVDLPDYPVRALRGA